MKNKRIISITISDEDKIESIIGREIDEILKEYREQHSLHKTDVINTTECYPKIKLN